MRFNKQEMTTLAQQPSQKFDKEGVLFLRERQEGFFRRSEKRWCRLRGNLLFYFKSREQWSEPVGVIVLEQCWVRVHSPAPDGPYGFDLVFEGGLSQHLAAYSEGERDAWLHWIQLASYECMRSQLLALQQRVELRRGHDTTLDVDMWRLRRAVSLDPTEVPLCELALACDNLLCDGHGRPPSPVVVVHASVPQAGVWVKYARTEVVEHSSNPSFLSTVQLRASDGLTADSQLRLTVYDVREHVSQTAAPLGVAVVRLSALQQAERLRLRLPLHAASGATVGFTSLSAWRLQAEYGGHSSAEATPSRDGDPPAHRRALSLPPRLSLPLRLPQQGPPGALRGLLAGVHMHTYRLHSGLAGDISVHELMAESRLCFLLPQQLLTLWVAEEKELLQEVAALGELREPWHSRQGELLDRHLQLLSLYAQARESLAAHYGAAFKPSSRKHERSLEFAPVNLHLQRMWAYSVSLRRSCLHDIITVGAFTAHSHKGKNGGLIKLLPQLKESPSRAGASLQSPTKISMAYDAVQAIKQLRHEVVETMRALMRLARCMQPEGMLSLCEAMVAKTRALLMLWDPGLVEEALAFLEQHKVAPPPALSPYRHITQQLCSLQLPAADADELASPDSPVVDADSVAADAVEKGATPLLLETLPPAASDAGRKFLDTQAMCSSPSANYYRPTDEPEPWDLTQLNIEASVMCLVSKVKFLCGRCSSPAVRLRTAHPSRLRLALSMDSGLVPAAGSDEPTKRTAGDVAVRNKFTEGLDFASLTDWTRELRPSMRKLRQAMDGLLKTARLTHSVFRVQQERRAAQRACNVRYRRDVCFSQAGSPPQLTALVTGLMAKLWCQQPDTAFLTVLASLGPLVAFEGLLSCYGDEVDMWGDMSVAVEDLRTVTFTLCHSSTADTQANNQATRWVAEAAAGLRLVGSRAGLTVLLPAPAPVLALLAELPVARPAPAPLSFAVTPVFFNIGINEMATLGESLGCSHAQQRSNVDNFERLHEYYHRYCKLPRSPEHSSGMGPKGQTSLAALMEQLRSTVHQHLSKNVQVLHLAAHVCRRMHGLRFTSCKSAKDRTGMAVTLEQCQVLKADLDLAEAEFQRALDCMRSEGCRRENTAKNIAVRRYAFNRLQLLALPPAYRPPSGTYGSAQS